MSDVDFATFVKQSGFQAEAEHALAEYRASRVVHTYKGEGLTACGLEVVGPCPDCERAT